MRHGFILEQPQHVRERVHYPEARDIAGVAKALFGDSRHIHVLDGRVRQLLRLEDAGELVEPRIGHFGHPYARGG